MGRVLGLDVGARRIGLAVSDELGITAQGLATLERVNRHRDLEYFRSLAREYSVERWLLGLPRHMSGDEGRQAEHVRRWGTALEHYTRIPVEYWDERLTTVEATRVLRLANSSLAQRRRAVDKLSAVILLQSYLDARANAAGPLASANDPL